MQLCKHRSQAGVNQLGVTTIPARAHASEIAVGFAIIAFWRNLSGPAALSVVQIEPTSCQAVTCGQFYLQRSPDRQPRLSR